MEDEIQDLLEELEAMAGNGIDNMNEDEIGSYNELVCEIKVLDPENEDAYEFIEA